MTHNIVLIVLTVVELLIVGTMWAVAWVVLDRCAARGRITHCDPRDILAARLVVIFVPAAGAVVGVCAARALSPSLSTYGMSAIFGATFGLTVALRCVRGLLRRTSRFGSSSGSAAAKLVITECPAAQAQRRQRARRSPAFRLPEHSPRLSASPRRSPRLFVR